MAWKSWRPLHYTITYLLETVYLITNDSNIDLFDNAIGYGKSLEEISHNIFRILRKVDSYNKDLVIIEGVKTEGLGLAIMNRLIRACSYNFTIIKDMR